MPAFESPTDLKFNRGPIADPEAFARDANAASWLFLCGEEFAAMEEGISYASAPFSGSDELRPWVSQGLGELA